MDRRNFIQSGALAAASILHASATKRNVVAGLRHREFHVSKLGHDQNDGSPSRMLRTISAAANKAYPGDVITVHQGVYRERIDPPRGGLSDAQRIVYQAAPGELVEIAGSEIVTGWVNVQKDLWKVVLPNTFFGPFNPYSDLIRGDWFNPLLRQHHTGAVYLNGEWLVEAAQQADVFKTSEGASLWFGKVDEKETTIWAQFKGINPNTQLTEINVRQSVFYPSRIGLNYITVRGFILRQAATPWAPPTAEQIGLIGPHWSLGWIIENNVICYSICSGISLGKYGEKADSGAHDSAKGYVGTIERALAFGWSIDRIGHHLVRGNTISHCEQAGIVGSLGAISSIITGNTIHEVYARRLFSGAEMAGIKLHAAIDVEINHNVIYRSYCGLWLDWMAQGTHVSKNLFYENDQHDLMIEVDHGPYLIDNNISLSKTSHTCISQGGAYAHNLFCGGTHQYPFDDRMTPFMKPHSTQIAGFHNNPSGDLRFYNNVFTQAGDLTPFNDAALPMFLGGNVFVDGAKPCIHEVDPLIQPDFNTHVDLIATREGNHLNITLGKDWGTERRRKLVTTEMLGKATIPDLPFELPDGKPIQLDTDYSGRSRNLENPFPGPFEFPEGGKQSLEIQLSPESVSHRFPPKLQEQG